MAVEQPLSIGPHSRGTLQQSSFDKLRAGDVFRYSASFILVCYVLCRVSLCGQIGYPVLIRAAYALGGLGSGFAENREEFVTQAEKGFAYSDQLIIDQVTALWLAWDGV